MSEVKEATLLQQLKAQHAMFVMQRDQAQINFQQLIGAIFACEQLIAQYEASLNQGEIDGEVKCEAKEQVA